MSAAVFGAVLVGLFGASHGPAAAPTVAVASPATRVMAEEVVAPQVVDVVFDKPVLRAPAPARTAAAAPARAARTTRTRTVPALRRTASVPAGDSGSCSGDGWQQRRGAKALESLLHPVPPGVTISFLPGRGALKGMTYYDQHHVDVYVNSCASESDSLLRHVVAHEMGHAWDAAHMTASLRADYLAARGIKASTPWFGCNGCQDFATPAGDFAETYAQWQRGVSTSRSQLAQPATSAQLAGLARFFS